MSRSLSQPFTTFRRQVSTQSAPLRNHSSESNQAMSTHDEISIEQEQAHLMGSDELQIPYGPVTTITASPMPRRGSVMSRLGSRLVPRYVNATSERDGTGQRRVLRRRLSDTSPTRNSNTPRQPHRRFSMFGSTSPTSSQSSSSTRRHLTPISHPIPHAIDESEPTLPLASTSPNPAIITEPTDMANHRPQTPSRSSRLERVRRSVASPLGLLDSFFGGSTPPSDRTSNPPRRPIRGTTADETDYLLPPLNVIDSLLDLEESNLRNRETSETRRSDALVPQTDASDRSPGWTQRWAERGPSVRRDNRRVPTVLRGRSSRIIRRDDEAPLSRILQLAAAAIATQLSGSADGITDMEAVGDDNFDGSLNNFLETLNSAAGVTAARNDTQVTVSNLPPLNFWRVFRFVNSSPRVEQRNTTETPQAAASVMENQATPTSRVEEEQNDGRSMTLVLVGVRSVPSSTLTRDPRREGVEHNLETLLHLPSEPSQTTRGGTGGLLRHANGTSRFSPRRRASIGAVNPFPAQYDSQRHQRMSSASRSLSGTSTPIASTTIPMVLSESPPGPIPPPSTPADPYLSAQPSGTNTPTRRPSTSTAMAHAASTLRRANEETGQDMLHDIPQTEALGGDTSSPHSITLRQRRRSDSETARHREFGAGSARRNGIIGTDEPPREAGLRSSRRNGIVEPDGASGARGRSWLIYVVGTNLSEDHPAFATPSLFTDVGHASCGRDMTS